MNDLLPAGIDIDYLKENSSLFNGVEDILLVQFSPDNPLRSGELRTIRMTFEQSDPVRFHKIFGLSDRGFWDRVRKRFLIFHTF